jgi:hypothetical protein
MNELVAVFDNFTAPQAEVISPAVTPFSAWLLP